MINSASLTPEDISRLLHRQNMLQAEAKMVIEDLDLVKLLSPLGSPVLLGSFPLGLMVWPDIDITVSCPGLTIKRAMEVMTPIFAHTQIHRVRYANEVGRFNPSGKEVDDRFYFGVYYQALSGTEWKIDISFWSSVNEHPEPFQEAAANQLTEEKRLAILWIKDIWYRLPTYRYQVYSVDIYDAVLFHGVRTPAEFDEYLKERGKPAR